MQFGSGHAVLSNPDTRCFSPDYPMFSWGLWGLFPGEDESSQSHTLFEMNKSISRV